MLNSRQSKDRKQMRQRFFHYPDHSGRHIAYVKNIKFSLYNLKKCDNVNAKHIRFKGNA